MVSHCQTINLDLSAPLPFTKNYLNKTLTGVVIVVQRKASTGVQDLGVNEPFASKFYGHFRIKVFFLLTSLLNSKHGCDYKGYGFACKLPRLDLTAYTTESIDKRVRPVLQSFCAQCQRQESWKENQLVLCDGCPKAFHQKCFHDTLTDEFIHSDKAWYCSDDCHDNLKRQRVIVESPRKRLPLMRTPKNAIAPTDTAKITRLPRSSLHV